jgi:hypothetical protein
MTLEDWKTGWDWAAIGFTTLTVISLAAALVVGNKISATKEAQLQSFDKDLVAAKERLAETQVALGNQTEVQTRLALDVTKAKTELAAQQERAAQAEQETARLRQRTNPRSLTVKQRLSFVAALKFVAPQTIRVGVTATALDEGNNFALQIMSLIRQAGWTIQNGDQPLEKEVFGDIVVIGVQLFVRENDHVTTVPDGVRATPVISALSTAFRSAGIFMTIRIYPTSRVGDISELVVGSKPETEKPDEGHRVK